MDVLILIAILLITYGLLDINTRLKHYLDYKAVFDPEFPIYSPAQIQGAARLIDVNRKQCEKQEQKLEEYQKEHEEIKHIKKNSDYPQEYKDLMCSYFDFKNNWDHEVYNYRLMIDTNYNVRNGKTSYSEASDKISSRLEALIKEIGKTNNYNEWLKKERK